MSYGILYVKKSKFWVWTAIHRRTRRIVALAFGSRGRGPALEIIGKVKDLNPEKIMTDYFKIYRDYFPADKHIASKKETYTVESVNSDIRHYIARFRRKTKCTSKSAEMGQAIASFSCF